MANVVSLSQHNREEQDQSLARARPAEQKQIPNRPPDQFQRRPLVFRKFKYIHKSNKSYFSSRDCGKFTENTEKYSFNHERHERKQKTESVNALRGTQSIH